MGLMDGKIVLIFGVANKNSIASGALPRNIMRKVPPFS